LESVIGATLQSKFDWMTNEVVNIINTLIGAIAAVLLALAWRWLSLG
ncbi:MAG: TIGR00297 family protein, partial [Coleofasciculus sp. C3-bin4]|nr:TIGR00297 family protein [Coleofasciculus sp. C3-bin4]